MFLGVCFFTGFHWNSKQPFFNWLFQLDDEPNLYIKNGWLEIIKHPLKTGCLGFQASELFCCLIDLQTFTKKCQASAWLFWVIVPLGGSWLHVLEDSLPGWLAERAKCLLKKRPRFYSQTLAQNKLLQHRWRLVKKRHGFLRLCFTFFFK